MTTPDDVPFVGFAGLSAPVARARLLAAHDRCGARVVQAGAGPEDTAAVACHTARSASAHLDRDHAGPGADRLVLTRSPTR